jgi:hypothetical protein
MLISSFNLILLNDELIDNTEDFENDIAEDDNTGEQTGLSSTRAGSVRSDKLSTFMDSFNDLSMRASSKNVSIMNSEVKLNTDDGSFRNDGYFTSIPIEPEGDFRWNRFYTNFSTFNYKRKITIDNTQNSANLIGYPIKITMNTEELISNGKMRPDCGDIRFYNGNGAELSYWIESGKNTDHTEVWVNVTSIPGSVLTYIYADYGHPELQSRSNGKNTFEFFDGFESLPKGYNTLAWKTGGSDSLSVYSRSSEKIHSDSYTLKAQFTNIYDYSYLYREFAGPLYNKIVTLHMYDDTSQNSNINIMDLTVSLNTPPATDFNRIATTSIPSQEYRYHYFDGSIHESTISSRGTGWHEIEAYLTTTKTEFYFDEVLAGTRIKSGYDNIIIAHQPAMGSTITHYGPEAIGGDVNITLQILNATDDSLLVSVSDGQDLSSITAKSIKLKAEFISNGWGTVKLLDWKCNWNTIPTIEDLYVDDYSVKRNETLGISVEAHDSEEPEHLLTIICEYRLPSGTIFYDDYLSSPIYDIDHWELYFSPPIDAKSGLYYFRITCNDSVHDTGEYHEQLIIDVENNIPLKPEIELKPESPTTIDDLEVIVVASKDIETPGNELEMWCRWYKDGNYMPIYDNYTILPSSATSRGQKWNCMLQSYDGEDFSPFAESETNIINSPPLIDNPVNSVVIKEDEINDRAVNLDWLFMDPDNDELYYTCTGKSNIVIKIEQTTGIVTFEPMDDWFGQETLVFTASDDKSEASHNIVAIVEPQNDAPELKKAGTVEVKPSDKTLEFNVYENAWINLTLIAEDADSDTLSFSTNRTDFIGIDDITKMTIENNVFRFHPDNDNVGIVPVNLSISDFNGSVSYYDLIINVINRNNPPSVSIVYPLSNMHFTSGKSIEFRSNYNDPDLSVKGTDEILTFIWESSEVYQPLGRGENLSTLVIKDLKVGGHEIKLTVKDKTGASHSDKIVIYIDKAEGSDMWDLSNSSSAIGLALLIIVIVIIIIMVLIIVIRKRRLKKALAYTPQPEAPATTPISPFGSRTIVTRPGTISAPTISMEQITPGSAPGHLPVTGQIPPTYPSAPAPPPPEPYMGDEVIEPSARDVTTPYPGIAGQPQLPPSVDHEPPEEEEEVDTLFDFGIDGGPKPVEKSAVSHDRPDARVVDHLDLEAATADLQGASTVRTSERPQLAEEEVDVSYRQPPSKRRETLKHQKELLAQLEKLGQLKEKGILTEAEFQRKKQELLNK